MRSTSKIVGNNPEPCFLRRIGRTFHRIRHYGLLASSARKANLALARRLLEVAPEPANDNAAEPDDHRPPCPCCGGRMVIIETFERWRQSRAPPGAPFTSILESKLNQPLEKWLVQ